MAKNVTKMPLDHMTKLSRLVRFFRPPHSSTDFPGPKLILLATWMDAHDTHIAKYVAQYQAIYPSSSILLIQSSFTCYWNSNAALRDIEPAVHIICEEISDDIKPQMLVHIFSNGGSCMMYHLYNSYAQHATHGEKETSTGSNNNSLVLPRHITIYDSVPGGWDYQSSTSAILHSFRAGLLRQLVFPLVHLLGLLWYIKYRVVRIAQEIVVWGDAHNSDLNRQEKKRIYIYSEADKMVDFRDVQAHRNNAVARGFNVTGNIKFIDSEHVAHARRYPEIYWTAVQDAWANSFEL